MKKRILILSSSPQRDRLIDEIMAEKLRARGNEVFVRPLPVGSRKAVLELQPNVVVLSPVRQRFAWDFTDTLCKFGIGVVLRHIEPGCDEEDLEVMQEKWKKILLLIRPPAIKLELFWSACEPEFVRRNGLNTPYAVVGAFVADIYKDKKLSKRICKKDDLFKKHNLDPRKKTLLISSPWGLLEITPDASDQTSASLQQQDIVARDRWCEMVRYVSGALGPEWQVLTTLHPTVEITPYAERLRGIPIDRTSMAAELLVHCDALVHAGSTMALEMHWLKKPAFQFGDVNSLDLPDGNWWQRRGCAISQISPFTTDPRELVKWVVGSKPATNASLTAIEKLEKGRYGSMDGKAIDRAVALIDQVEGEFKTFWPQAPNNYDQTFLFKDPGAITARIRCNICENIFFVIHPQWIERLNHEQKSNITMPRDKACPYCAHNIAEIIVTKEMIGKALNG